MTCEHEYRPLTRRGIVPTRGKLVGLHRCKRCGDTVRRIEPDMIVRVISTGQTYKVRSVSKTKAVVQPLSPRRSWQGFQYPQTSLEIVRRAPARPGEQRRDQ